MQSAGVSSIARWMEGDRKVALWCLTNSTTCWSKLAVSKITPHRTLEMLAESVSGSFKDTWQKFHQAKYLPPCLKQPPPRSLLILSSHSSSCHSWSQETLVMRKISTIVVLQEFLEVWFCEILLMLSNCTVYPQKEWEFPLSTLVGTFWF